MRKTTFSFFCVFALVLSALLHSPAWGGGWESSGSPVQSPIIIQPLPFLPYACEITIRVGRETDIYTETLTREHFVSGIARIRTPGLPNKNYLSGHVLTFAGFPDGTLSLQLEAMAYQGGTIVSRSSAHSSAPLTSKRVSTRLILTTDRTVEIFANCHEKVGI